MLAEGFERVAQSGQLGFTFFCGKQAVHGGCSGQGVGGKIMPEQEVFGRALKRLASS
jgi:hypothetical protein